MQQKKLKSTLVLLFSVAWAVIKLTASQHKARNKTKKTTIPSYKVVELTS
jgi:hypothetical protein